MHMAATFLLTALIIALSGFTSPTFAMDGELVIPEKVEVGHKACQELMRLGKKYQVEGLFTKEFEAGQCQINRLDMALAVQMITEKMAEKAASEGVGAVDRKDLAILSDIKEELRGEMLLAQSRAFQWRYSALGTNFHALTKNITLGGGMVGIVQGSFGNKPKDHSEVVGRGDLVFNFKVGENTIAVIDVEATGGDGIDAKIPSFSLLNGVAGSTGDRVRFREAWVEHSAFSEKLIMTAGKIDLTNYFDTNSIANDENSQFLAGAFVNSAVLGAPGMGPGVRVHGKLADSLTLGFGYGSGDTDSADIFDHGFGVAELDYRLKLAELEGNYRLYGSLDGAAPDGTRKLSTKNAFGCGLSMDQQISEKLTLFGRYGWHDENAFSTKSAWSAGFQYLGPIPQRGEDFVGFGYGQVLANNATAQEKLLEFYYNAKISDQIAMSPHFQYLINPLGDKDAHNVLVIGLRSQIVF